MNKLKRCMIKVKDVACIAAQKTKVFCYNHGDKILLGAGLTLGGACVVTACYKSFNLENILLDHSERCSFLTNDCIGYDSRDLVREYAKTVGMIIKNYAIPALLGLLSVACLVGSHAALSAKYASLSAAYTMLSESFESYRAKTEQATEKMMEAVESGDEEAMRQQALDNCRDLIDRGRWLFDECNNINWTDDAYENKRFLDIVEARVNNALATDQIVHAIDVLIELGYDPARFTKAQMMWATNAGWINGRNTDGIRLGHDDLANNPSSRMFIYGGEPSVWLTLNAEENINEYIPENGLGSGYSHRDELEYNKYACENDINDVPWNE